MLPFPWAVKKANLLFEEIHTALAQNGPGAALQSEVQVGKGLP